MTTVEQPSNGAMVDEGVPANSSLSSSEPRGAYSGGRRRGAATLVRGVASVASVLLLLGGAGFAAWWLLTSAPEQETVLAEPTRPTVEVITPEPGDVDVTMHGFGEVIPAREASIAPEVVGRVVEVGAAVEPGGFLDQGALLFRVDPSDYEVALAQAEADLAQARADLELERGRAVVAQQEWERFRETLSGVDETERSSALANREPQLRQAEARVQQAEAALALARLNLERTEVRAPFRATVIRETVEVGLRVGPDMTVVDLAGTDTFWVTVAVPPSQGSRLSTGDQRGAPRATVSVDGGLGDRSSRDARLVRVLPDVDPSGRMIRALVAIDDPLGRASDEDVIRLGDYASVAIDAGALIDAVELPRGAVRENDEIWVLSAESTLRVIPVTIRWRNDDTVVASAEFRPGDRVITSFLSDPVPGQSLRAREAP